MKRKIVSLLLCLTLVLLAAFGFAACSKKDKTVKGLSAAGNKFYFETKKYAEDLAALDFSVLPEGLVSGDNYQAGFNENQLSFDYFFEGDFDESQYKGVSITIDKGFSKLPDYIALRSQNLISQGILTPQELEDIIESGYLENILYQYMIAFYEKIDDEFCYYSCESYVFANKNLLTEALNSHIFDGNNFPPFVDRYVRHGNALIDYRPYLDGAVIGAELQEPDSNTISEIKIGLQNITDIIKSLI